MCILIYEYMKPLGVSKYIDDCLVSGRILKYVDKFFIHPLRKPT